MTFFLSVIGMIISLSIMYISISRMTNLLLGAAIAGVAIPILLNVVWFALLPFFTVRDYPQASFPVPTGPGVAIMVSCWIGLVIGYYAGLQQEKYGDESCYRCSLMLLGILFIALVAFILVP